MFWLILCKLTSDVGIVPFLVETDELALKGRGLGVEAPPPDRTTEDAGWINGTPVSRF